MVADHWYMHRGQLADARRAFERAVALDCDNEPAQQNLANARAVVGRTLVESRP